MWLRRFKVCTYDKVADDHCQQKERNADESGAVNTVPHGLNPLAAQNPKYNHKRVEEISEMPSQFAPVEVLGDVVGAEELHSHDGEDEDDDGQDETEVTESAHCPTNDADE